MRQQLRQLTGDTAIYGVTTIVQRLLSFLLTPFYTWFLSPAEFGVQSSVFAVIALTLVISNAGMEAAYFRFEAAATDDENRRRVFWNALSVNWLVAAALTALMVASPSLSNTILFFGLQPADLALIRYAGVIMFLDSASAVAMASLRMERRAKAFGAIRIASILVNVGANIWLVAGLGLGLHGVFVAGILQSATLFVLTLPVLRRKLPFGLDAGLRSQMLRFGVPTVGSGLAMIALQVIDRPIMIALIGDAATGLYQAGFRLAIPLMMFVTMFEFAWRPFFLQQADKENARELYARVFTYFNVVAGTVFLLVAFFVASLAAVPIPFTSQTLIGSRFWAGLSIVPLILAGYVFVGWYTNFIVGVYIEKRTGTLPLITGLGAVTKAGLCFLLIPALGLFGGAWATLIAYVIMAAVLLVFVQRIYPIPYEWGRVARALAGVAALYAINAVLLDFDDTSLRAVLIRTALLAVYPLWLWATGFFNRSELAQLARIRSTLIRR